VDLVCLDVKRLSVLVTLLFDSINAGNHCRMTGKQVVGIVTEAVQAHLVTLDDLQPRVREEVQRVLNRSD